MPLSLRIRNPLLFVVRKPRRSILFVLVLAGLACSAWYGIRAIRYNRSFKAAQQALSEYDFATARACLQECARLRPDRPDVLLLAAQTARRDADHAAAANNMAAYRQLIGHTTPEGLLEETLLRVTKGPADEDVNYLLVLIDSDHPANEMILEALAIGSREIYHLHRTSFWVGQLLSRYPRNAVGRLIRIQMDATLARPARATEECRQLLSDFPKFQLARQFLAMQLVQQQKYEEAVLYFEELRKHRPGDLSVLLGLVVCLERMGRVDELRPLIEDLQVHRADNSEALLHIGRFAMREQRWTEAEQFLSKALQLAPNDHDIHKELAVCLYQLGKPEDAQRHADRTREIEVDLAKLEKQVLAVIQAPRDPEPRLEAARLCLRNGQNAEGFRWLSGALEVAPKHKPTHEALADYYAANGNHDLAAHHRALAK